MPEIRGKRLRYWVGYAAPYVLMAALVMALAGAALWAGDKWVDLPKLVEEP